MSLAFRESESKVVYPCEWMGYKLPICDHNGDVFESTDDEVEVSYVIMGVEASSNVWLHHMGVGVSKIVEMVDGIKVAFYLKSPEKVGVMKKEYLTLVCGLNDDGSKDMKEMETKDNEFVVVYKSGSFYYTPIIVEETKGDKHMFVRVELKRGVPASECKEVYGRKVVTINGECVELCMENRCYCMVCCDGWQGAPGLIEVNGNGTMMSACSKCCKEIEKGNKPWKMGVASLGKVLEKVESSLEEASSIVESLLSESSDDETWFDYGNEKMVMGQMKSFYQDSIRIDSKVDGVLKVMSKKRMLTESEIADMKKQCSKAEKNSAEIKISLDSFQEGFDEYKAKR